MTFGCHYCQMALRVNKLLDKPELGEMFTEALLVGHRPGQRWASTGWTISFRTRAINFPKEEQTSPSPSLHNGSSENLPVKTAFLLGLSA